MVTRPFLVNKSASQVRPIGVVLLWRRVSMEPDSRKRQEPQDTVDLGLDPFQRTAVARGDCNVSSGEGDAPGCLPLVAGAGSRETAIGRSSRCLSSPGDKTKRDPPPFFSAQLPPPASSPALSIQLISITDVSGPSYATLAYDELGGAPLFFLPVFDM